MTTELIEKARILCKELIKISRCDVLPFHNWEHTKDVVENANLIAEHEKLPKETIEELVIASYFHDTGFIKGCHGHEQLSCDYAEAFLIKEGISIVRITHIHNIITATEMPQRPETQPQKIICDADLSHLGKNNFIIKNNNLRKEWSIYNNLEFTDEQWQELNIRFLKNHTYHTAFARAYYANQKEKNIRSLEEMLVHTVSTNDAFNVIDYLPSN